MSSSEESFEQMSVSEEEYKPTKPSARAMNLRERNKRRLEFFIFFAFKFKPPFSFIKKNKKIYFK